MNITIMAIASALGLDLARAAAPEEQQEYGAIVPDGGLSIAEIAAQIKPPVAGGDTLAASREAFRLMMAEPQGSA